MWGEWMGRKGIGCYPGDSRVLTTAHTWIGGIVEVSMDTWRLYRTDLYHGFNSRYLDHLTDRCYDN